MSILLRKKLGAFDDRLSSQLMVALDDGGIVLERFALS